MDIFFLKKRVSHTQSLSRIVNFFFQFSFVLDTQNLPTTPSTLLSPTLAFISPITSTFLQSSNTSIHPFNFSQNLYLSSSDLSISGTCTAIIIQNSLIMQIPKYIMLEFILLISFSHIYARSFIRTATLSFSHFPFSLPRI